MLKEFYFIKPTVVNSFFLTRYNYVRHGKRYIGYIKKEFHTLLIDLSQDLTSIRKQYRSNYRNEISKAIRLNGRVNFNIPIDTHIRFYNENNNRRIHSQINVRDYEYLAFNISLDNNIYASHLYLVSKYEVVLVSSCTLHTTNSEILKIAGYFNKCLHDKVIEYFKLKGKAYYNFGGIAINTTNKKMLGINKFKQGFGGRTSVYFEYESLAVVMFRRFTSIISSIR